MDFVVCLKQSVDLQQVRIKKETRTPVLEGIPFVFGDMDRNALEEAVKTKEKAAAGKVMALSLGSAKLRDTIKDALARGADEAYILIDPVFDTLDSRGKAEALAKAIQKIGKFDLILMGEGSTDNYSGQTPGRVAEMLGLPFIAYATQLELGNGKVRATRNMEDSVEVIEAPLPAIVSVTAEINKPRIPSLTQILRAGKKPVQEWKSGDIGLAAAPAKEVTVVSNLAPVEQRKQVIFETKVEQDVTSLVDALTKEGVWQH